MKNIIHTLPILMVLVLLTLSCSDDSPQKEITPVPPEPEVLEIISELPPFKEEASSQILSIKSSVDWSIKADQSWCTIAPSTGKAGTHALTVTVAQNESTDERNTSVVLQSAHNKKQITLTQKQKDALLLSSNKAELSAEAQQLSVEVKANITYTLHIDEMAKTWIKASKSRALQKNIHTFNITANDSPEPRQGQIQFEGNGCTEIFTVYQQPGEESFLILNQKEFIVDYKGENVKIELKSNTNYQMVLPEVDWIHEDPSRATSTYTHYLTVDANPSEDERTAKIFFNYHNQTDSVTIIQKSKDVIVLAKDLYELNSQTGELSFEVSSNVPYRTICKASWIQLVSISRAMTTKQLTFKISPNEEAATRKAEIIFDSGHTKQTVTIIQKGIRLLSQCSIFIRQTSKNLPVPIFTGDAPVTGQITWGYPHRKESPFKEGLILDFDDYSLNNSAQFDMKQVQEIYIDDIKDIQSIQFDVYYEDETN